MNAWLEQAGGVVILLALIVVPGWAVLAIWPDQRAKRIDLTFGETLYILLFTGTGITGWVALILAELGFFSLSRLATVVIGGSVIVFIVAAVQHRPMIILPRLQISFAALLFLCILTVAAILYFRPYEYVLGGRDHGVYVNTGVHIARTGKITVHDDLLANASPELRSLLTNYDMRNPTAAWDQGRLLTGFYVTNQYSGESVPHGFHLYPVYYAILYAAVGLKGGLLTTSFLALGGVAGFYLVGKRLFGWPVGTLASVIFSFNLGQIWYARTPSAEILLQFLFWGGLFAFLLLLDTGQSLWACISGAAFGLMHLTKIEYLFVPLGLLLFFLVSWLRHHWHPSYWSFLIVYFALMIHTLLHAAFVAAPYAMNIVAYFVPDSVATTLSDVGRTAVTPLDLWGRLLAVGWEWIIIAVILMVASGVLLWFGKPKLECLVNRLSRHGKLYRLLGVAIILAGATFSYYIWPVWSISRNAEWLVEFGWYLGGTGLLLAVAGYGRLVAMAESKQGVIFLVFFTGVVATFTLMGSATYPDHFWAFRRYIPVLLPAAILLGAMTLLSLWPEQREWWVQATVPLLLGGVWLIGTFQTDMGFVQLVEYRGVIDQLTMLTARFPYNAVILIEGDDAGGRIATPLRFIGERSTFTIQSEAIHDNEVILEQAVEDWINEGRKVYWLGTSNVSLPEGAHFYLNYEDTVIISGPMAEQGVGHLPQRVGEWATAVDIYQFVPGEKSSDRVLVLDVGSDTGTGSGYFGFYQEQPIPGLSTAWWTTAEAEIKTSLSWQPTQILLRLAGWPGTPSGPPISVFVNGKLIGYVEAHPRFEVFTFTLLSPVQSDNLLVQLVAETWNPFQAGYNQDDRDLGVRVDWVRFVRDE